MKVLMLFILGTWALAHGFPSSDIKITNGTDAVDGEYPWIVSFRYRNCHNCGGSIISDRWVLTAAHCVYPNSMNFSSILYGTNLAHNCEDAPSFINKIKRVIVHENYETFGGHINDIALLEMEEPFVFSDKAQPVALPKQGGHPEDPNDAVLVGWGYQEVGGKVMPILQQVDLVIFDDEICESYHSEQYSRVSHVCAGVWGNGKGQCSGDSGGPLTVEGVQYGIVSWSDKPCASSPGVLTRVSSFIDWIHNATGIYNF